MKRNKGGPALLLACLLLGGCQGGGTAAPDATAAGEQQAQAQTQQTAVSADVSGMDLAFSASDLDVGYEESTACSIQLSDGGITIEGEGAAAEDGVLTITAAGTYVITGSVSQGRVVIQAGEKDKVQLVLSGASIQCGDYAALTIEQADKVLITLADGTVNTLCDGADYTAASEEDRVDAALFSRADLTINGSGALEVIGQYRHGIVSKDDLIITGGALTVKAAADALCGKDCVKISGGSLKLEAGSDGIQSDNTEQSDRGFVYIAGGEIVITAGADGIKAETLLKIDGGTLDITSGGGSAGGQAALGNQTGDEDTPSTKGLKAGALLKVDGGTIRVDALDDALHTNGELAITSGTITLSSSDDGIHADGSVEITGGTLSVTQSYEGIEGASVTISGGILDVAASDDGINSAGGSDTCMENRMGRDGFISAEAYDIRISGGEITLRTQGDGIDANGSFYLEGGTVWIHGPSSSGNGALDYDGTAEVTGGVLVAAGSAGMAMGFDESSAQCSILYAFSGERQAGETVTLSDASGQTIVAFTPEKAYASIVITSPELIQGEQYTLTSGDEAQTLTLTGQVTSNHTGMGGFGRQGGGKGPGGW